jgi:hypothetical protein
LHVKKYDHLSVEERVFRLKSNAAVCEPLPVACTAQQSTISRELKRWWLAWPWHQQPVAAHTRHTYWSGAAHKRAMLLATMPVHCSPSWCRQCLATHWQLFAKASGLSTISNRRSGTLARIQPNVSATRRSTPPSPCPKASCALRFIALLRGTTRAAGLVQRARQAPTHCGTGIASGTARLKIVWCLAIE